MDYKKIIYMDGGLASQMSAYAFLLYLKNKGLDPEVDFIWYKRLGKEKYKLKEVFDVIVPEYQGSFKYDIYISKNIIARVLRKTKLLKLLIKIGIIPKLYYTGKPFWGGIIFNVDELPKEALDNKRETYFWGYWPFGRYFNDIKEKLFEVFTFPQFTEEENLKLNRDIELNNSVSIHVRRGDYLNLNDVYAEVSIRYYENAIRYINEFVLDLKFYVFSDDIQWCKLEFEKLGLTNENTIYVDWNYGAKSYRDMQLMSLCKHNIISNSGFSAWAAFLNKSKEKIVIEPKEYFTEKWKKQNEEADCKYYVHRSDITFDFAADNEMTIHNNVAEPWKVTLVDTGLNTMTGGRIKRVMDYINNETFLLTYGDGVSDLDINELIKFHNKNGKTATITAIQPGGRFGVLDVEDNDQIHSFSEKSKEDGGWINGGFMVLEPDILNYIEGDDTILERDPLEKLAKEGQLMAYRHDGFWQCMDTQRDREYLEKLISDNNAPWMKWCL